MPQNESTPEVNMELYETYTHPFVVKIWLEETVSEAGKTIWRGHITHVPSNTRRYVQQLDEITAFIAPYLVEMGVELGLRWRMKQRLQRWKLKLKNRFYRNS